MPGKINKRQLEVVDPGKETEKCFCECGSLTKRPESSAALKIHAVTSVNTIDNGGVTGPLTEGGSKVQILILAITHLYPAS